MAVLVLMTSSETLQKAGKIQSRITGNMKCESKQPVSGVQTQQVQAKPEQMKC